LVGDYPGLDAPKDSFHLNATLVPRSVMRDIG